MQRFLPVHWDCWIAAGKIRGFDASNKRWLGKDRGSHWNPVLGETLDYWNRLLEKRREFPGFESSNLESHWEALGSTGYSKERALGMGLC